MVKKLMSLALILIMVLAFAPATSAQDDAMEVFCGTDEEANLVIAGGAVGIELELTESGAARFMEACPNITVEILETPDSTDDRLSLYFQFFEAESADVDVMQLDVIWPGLVAENLLDLGEVIPEDMLSAALDGHFERIVAANNVDGRQVAIPWFTDAGLLYYRTDLLEKYGLEVPTTWQELTDAATTIQEGERAEGNDEFWGFVWQGNAYEGLTCDALEWQFSATGENFIDGDGNPQVTDDAWIAQLELAASWVGNISPDGVTGYQEEDARNVFQAGNAAFMRNWPYAFSLGNAEDSAIAGLFDVSPLPEGEAGVRAATLGGWNLGVNRFSENPEAAAALVLFLTSEDEQRIRAVEGSYNPTIESLYEDEAVLEANPFFGSLFDVFTNAVPRPSAFTGPAYNEVSRLYFEAIHSVLTGEAFADEAMEFLAEDLAAVLAE